MGLEMTDLGFYSQENSAADRTAVEENVRAALDQGIACSVINLENQMITGYDEERGCVHFRVGPGPDARRRTDATPLG